MRNLIHYLFFFVFLSFSALQVYGNVGNAWGYKYQDGLPPHEWPRLHPACGGTRQSPIKIDTSTVVLDTELKPFDFKEINMIDHAKMTLINHGKTVEVELAGKDCFIVGGGLHEKYKVKQFHFHWGTADQRGSEHDYNGKQYPMEMHIVTYQSKFHDFKKAMNSTNGLAVMSFFIEIGPENAKFNDIVASFAKIIREDDNATLTNFPLISLIPRDHQVYYRYYGSLTTPPCYESVLWTVFQSPITISKRQIEQFRLLGSRHINKFRDIADNYRNLQPLNGRYVFTNDIRGILPTRHQRLLPRISTRRRQNTTTSRRQNTSTSRRQNTTTNRRQNITTSRRRQDITTSKRQSILRQIIQLLRKNKKQKIRKPDPVNPLILELSRRLKAELKHATRRYPVKVIKQISPKYTIRKLPKFKVTKAIFPLYKIADKRISISTKPYIQVKHSTNHQVMIQSVNNQRVYSYTYK